MWNILLQKQSFSPNAILLWSFFTKNCTVYLYTVLYINGAKKKKVEKVKRGV